MPTLFDPVQLGDLRLPNRVVMAPLTRDRATPGTDTPHALNAQYYRQRASAGLIISEATQISPEGKGYAWTPGIYSDAQVAGWREVVDAVHAEGGRIVLQLWHVGRISHTSLQPGGAAPVSASALRAEKTKTFIEQPVGFVDTSTPRALEATEIPRLIGDYRRAAENAKAAGFDGIELHAANGYLAPAIPFGRDQPADRCLWRHGRQPRSADPGGARSTHPSVASRARGHPPFALDRIR